MTKKITPVTALDKSSNVATFELNDTALALAARFGLNLTDAKDTCGLFIALEPWRMLK